MKGRLLIRVEHQVDALIWSVMKQRGFNQFLFCSGVIEINCWPSGAGALQGQQGVRHPVVGPVHSAQHRGASCSGQISMIYHTCDYENHEILGECGGTRVSTVASQQVPSNTL